MFSHEVRVSDMQLTHYAITQYL